ncbi:MAG: hypothetical protein ABI947_00175 [Chloroflexota bacterium]
MYVRVAIAEIKPGMLDELSEEMIRNFEAGVALATPIPGFLGHQFMISHESNKMAIISRWTTQADELANRQGNVQQQSATLANYFAGRPAIEVFEVRFEV